MGTATEQSLRNILTELETHTLPDDAATQTTLAALLTELQAKLETADLNLDATKDLQVDVKTMPTTTVQAAGGDKLFGFEDTAGGRASNLALGAGVNNLTIATVPSGKFWVITNIMQYYVGTVPTSQTIRAIIDGLEYDLAIRAGAVFPDGFTWTGQLVLGPDDYVVARITGATAGDQLHARMVGYVMDAP